MSAVLLLSLAMVSACSSSNDNGGGPQDTTKSGAKPDTNTDTTADTTGDSSEPSAGGGAGDTASSSSDPGAAQPGAGGTGDSSGTADGGLAMDPTDPHTPLSSLPENCRGFEVEGLKYSPGGDVLPNTCAPFDGWLNNPYAIRCIDADSSYHTGYLGDEYCILPPDPAKGMQLRVGPDYSDPESVKPFLLQPDQEINTYYYLKSPNDQEVYYYRANWRMRQGSHHMIITLLSTDKPDGWVAGGGGSTDFSFGTGQDFGGAQRTDVDRPQGTLEIPPENVGMGGSLAAHQQFSFNLHHIDYFSEPIVREAWVNVWFMNKEDVTQPMQGISMFGNPADMNIAPGVHVSLEYKCAVTGNSRIITLLGHRHASTDRFGVWVVRGDSGETVPVYESFNWEDMPTYQYDSVSQNPLPNVDKKIDGGYSGELSLAPGDEVHFLCDVNNQSDQMLKFANELFTGEMCILFGSYTGDPLCRTTQRVQ